VEVCNDFLDLPGVPGEKRTWTAAREAEDLLDFDVGLMPLDDRPFSRGKCGLKILQYQAAGVPVVCSPVGANNDIVTHEETGLFAAGEGWADAIVRLLTDRFLAARLAEAARRRVAGEYSAAVVGGRLADLLLEAAGPGAGRRSKSAAAEAEEDEGDGEPQDHQRLLVADHLGERPALGPFREPPR
jgi:glycosyltransferase involved in cell wall biosynthesis